MRVFDLKRVWMWWVRVRACFVPEQSRRSVCFVSPVCLDLVRDWCGCRVSYIQQLVVVFASVRVSSCSFANFPGEARFVALVIYRTLKGEPGVRFKGLPQKVAVVEYDASQQASVVGGRVYRLTFRGIICSGDICWEKLGTSVLFAL